MSLNVQPGFRAAEAVKPASAPIQGKTSPIASAKNSGGNGFSFWDLIDIVNPLQHIPVVGTIYRAVTGDKISNFSRVAGGAVFGGLAGAAIGLVNTVAVVETGEDIGEMAMNKMGFGSGDESAAASKNIPVVEVRPLAENKKVDEKISADVANALPPAKSLNDINTVSGFNQSVEPKQIPTAMMDALLKYQEMQSLPITEQIDEKSQEEAKITRRFRDQLPADRLIATR